MKGKFGGLKRLKEKWQQSKMRKIAKQEANRVSQRDNELKYDNLNYTATLTYNWALSNLTAGIGAGTTDITRIGDAVTMKNLEIRWRVAAADATNVCRMVVYVAKNGDTTDLPFETDGSYETPLSLYNHDYRRRYKVLWDRTISTSTSGSNQVVSGHKIINLRNMVAQYTTASTTCVKNALYLAVVSDSAAVPHPSPVIHCRLYYVG